jgi:hypothetical protein
VSSPFISVTVLISNTPTKAWWADTDEEIANNPETINNQAQ